MSELIRLSTMRKTPHTRHDVQERRGLGLPRPPPRLTGVQSSFNSGRPLLPLYYREQLHDCWPLIYELYERVCLADRWEQIEELMDKADQLKEDYNRLDCCHRTPTKEQRWKIEDEAEVIRARIKIKIDLFIPYLFPVNAMVVIEAVSANHAWDWLKTYYLGESRAWENDIHYAVIIHEEFKYHEKKDIQREQIYTEFKKPGHKCLWHIAFVKRK